MKAAGIIAEYNPFHNGHAFHLAKCAELTDRERVVAVMSGDYVQRGGPAIVGKSLRTEMALRSGVNVVLGLPAVFSLAGAERFAFAAVCSLDATNAVDSLCFGSEEPGMEKIEYAAELLISEPPEFKSALKERLDGGAGFATARHAAANRVAGTELPLRRPNEILAVEYVKALKKLKSPIRPFASPRIDASATEARESALNGRYDDLEHMMPGHCVEILKRAPRFTDIDDFSPFLHYALTMGVTYDVMEDSEGLLNRIKSASKSNYLISDVVRGAASKRYTDARIRRVIMYTILGVTREFFGRYGGRPPYLRVLGFNERGGDVLRAIVKGSSVPVVINVRKDLDRLRRENPAAADMLELDMRASELYAAASRAPGNEFKYEVVVV